MTEKETVPLLEVRALSRTFTPRWSLAERARRRPRPRLVALDGVSLTVHRNETLGIVGESGSGKTTLGRCILRLVEPDEGSVTFDGVDVRAARSHQLRDIRRRMQLIYQDPYSSLNPRMSVGDAIAEPARVHQLVSKGDQDRRVKELLDLVGLPESVRRRRPRELSGGQRQRVAIARALAAEPELIIADEAVSALDVSIQAQILNLLADLNRDLGLALVFIAHQLSVIAHVTQRVAIMYLGRIVEHGPTTSVFHDPRHPYSAGLLEANPRLDGVEPRSGPALVGEIPSPLAVPSGCRFHTRCRYRVDRCLVEDPAPAKVGDHHQAWCHVLPHQHQDVR